MIIAVNFSIQATGKKKPEKSGVQRDSNRRDTGAMLYQSVTSQGQPQPRFHVDTKLRFTIVNRAEWL